MQIDNIELTDSELELYEERLAICIHEGLISFAAAEKEAEEMIRRRRNDLHTS